jgi:GT2 family glycosyltransferase
MRFSLILATVGRVRELERFFRSLRTQTYSNFEVIVVDQNPDDRLKDVLNRYAEDITLKHLRSQPGLSRARNVGLNEVQGEIVSFPDDDCWYPPHLLADVAAFFQDHREWSGVLGRMVWEEERDGGKPTRCSPLNEVNRYNVTTSVDAKTVLEALLPKEPPISVSAWTLFLRSEAARAIGGFDETLGLGSGTGWGGGEDVDLAIRCLHAGFSICYCPALKGYHPNLRERQSDPRRGFLYGAGMGRVLRKHRYPKWFVFYHFLRSLGGAARGGLKGEWSRARYQWAVFRGKVAGWWKDDSQS